MTDVEEPLGEVGVRDTWVLFFVILSWLLLFVPWLVRNRTQFVLNHAHVLVKETDGFTRRRSQAGKLEDEPCRSHFLFDPASGLPRRRSLAAFREGRETPPGPSCTFQWSYSTSRRLLIYSTLAKGALTRCWRFVCTCGLFAMTLTWWARSSDSISQKINTNMITYDAVFGNLQAAAEVQRVLLPLASFVLALYINMKLGWFNTVISLTWGIQGKLGDLALVLGSSATPSQDEAVLGHKYRVYRYLNLVHFFLYQALVGSYAGAALSNLADCGLVTAEEQLLLERSANKRGTVLVWLGAVFRELASRGNIQADILPHVLDTLAQLRGSADTLAKELTRVAPVTFAQLMQLMVDMLLLMTPPALTYLLKTTRSGVSVYLWPALGSMVLALFYQGGMKLIAALEYPFGSDLDDLRPDWLLMSSDRAIFGYLSSPLPSLTAPPPDDRAVTVTRSDLSARAVSVGKLEADFEAVLPGALPKDAVELTDC